MNTVILQQDAVAVYLNADDAIMIVQGRPDTEDTDVVAIDPIHAEALIRGIRDAKRQWRRKQALASCKTQALASFKTLAGDL